jgi:hypothetical protein
MDCRSGSFPDKRAVFARQMLGDRGPFAKSVADYHPRK